jgi:hypothetical protein
MTADMPEDRVDGHIESVARGLQARLGTRFEFATIVAQVETAFGLYRDARVTDFVPILATRRARALLRTVAAHEEVVDPVSSVSSVLVDATRL